MRDDRTTGMLLSCGVVGRVLFIVVAFVAGAVRPGYRAWHTYVSMLMALRSLRERGVSRITSSK